MLKALVIGLLTIAAYWPVRQAPWLYEDAQNLPAQTFRLPNGPDFLPGRYLTGATIAFDQWRGGSSIQAHQTNLALHLVNGLLVYVLARALGLGSGAWLAALLFLLHPIQTQAVSYLSARADLVMTTAILSTLLLVCHVAADVEGVCLVGLSAWACLMTKEAAIVIVGLIPLVAWAKGYHWATWLGALVLCSVFVLLSWPTVLSLNHRNSMDPIRYAAYQLAALWAYLGLIVWPRGLSIEHDVFRWPVIVPIFAQAATIAVCGWAWIQRQRVPLVALGIGWVLVVIAPRLIVRLPDPLGEAQVYLAFVGVCLALGALWKGSADVYADSLSV